MKVLIINHNGGALKYGPNLRTYYAAKELVSYGHEVTIASSSYSHKYSVLPETSGTITKESIDGVEYRWVKCLKYNNLFQRIYSHFEFGFKILKNRRKICTDADLVVFSGPPPEIFLFSWVYSKILRAPVVSDIRDLWPRTQLEMNSWQWLNPYTHFLFLCQLLLVHGSARIISPLPGIGKYLSTLGRKSGVVIIENGFDLEREPKSPNMVLNLLAGAPSIGGKVTEQLSLNAIRHSGKFVVGYAGAFDRDNDLDSILCAAKQMSGREDILFMFVGDGIRRDYVIEIANSLPNIIVCERVPSDLVPTVLSVMDVCYCGLKPKNIYQYGVSLAKSFEYMASGKPVLWMVDAYNSPIGESGGGIEVKPGDIKALASAIKDCALLDKNELQKMGQKAYQYIKRKHSYEILGAKWNALVGELDAPNR